MTSLRQRVAANVDEVASDWVLRAFGVCVALTYALSALYWLLKKTVPLVSSGADAVCWPGLDVCRGLRWMGEGSLTIYLLALLVVALVSAFCLARPKSVRWGLLLLFCCLLLKGYFMSLDYRTRLNQHYMAFFATVAYLFVPGKRDALRLLVVFFYVWAGSLKLNHEWISGAGLYDQLWFFHGRWVPMACVYVIVLELALIWLLLSRNRILFWGALGQLAVFHLFSFELVGFFYPLLMYLLLAIFVFCAVAEPRDQGLGVRLWRGQVRRGPLAFVLFVALLQLTPHFYGGDPSLTAEGRLFGLHMFDARVRCDGRVIVHNAAGETATRRPDWSFRRSTRMGCDPNVFIHFAKNLCGSTPGGFGEVVEADLYLSSRKVTSGRWQRIIEHRGFCARPLRFNAVMPNEWVVER